MLLVRNPNHDPAFNLALEDYLLTSFEQEIVCLWRNEKAVIIGRNQNAIEEIDLDFVQQNNITVIRRMTGGGAVFHDLGNINFTFIEPYREGDFNNYDKFTSPIRDYLRSLGVDARLSGRNDLTVDDMKISGNAQTVKNGRIMHHGTLLFSLNMGHLVGALRPRDIKIQSKGVKSVRSRVTNIASHLKTPMTVEEFQQGLEDYLLAQIPGLVSYNLTHQDLDEVQKLVDEKYGQWDWNFGSSPKCDIAKEQRFDFGIVEVRICVEEGRISALTILGDFFGMGDKVELEKHFIGVRHRYDELLAAAQSIDLGRYIHGITPEQIADLLA